MHPLPYSLLCEKSVSITVRHMPILLNESGHKKIGLKKNHSNPGIGAGDEKKIMGIL